MSEIFLCSVCKNEFSNWWNLRKHIYTHLPKSDKRFKCSVCNYTTIQKFTAKRHLQKKHNNVGEVIESKLSIETLEEHRRIYTESQKYSRQVRLLQNPEEKLPPTPQIIIIQPQILKSAQNGEFLKSIMKPKIIIRRLPENQNELVDQQETDNGNVEGICDYAEEANNYLEPDQVQEFDYEEADEEEEQLQMEHQCMQNLNAAQTTDNQTLEQMVTEEQLLMNVDNQNQNIEEHFATVTTATLNQFNNEILPTEEFDEREIDNMNIIEATQNINELQSKLRYNNKLMEIALSPTHINDLIEFNEAEDEVANIAAASELVLSLPIPRQAIHYSTQLSTRHLQQTSTNYRQQQQITNDPVLGNSCVILNDDCDDNDDDAARKVNNYALFFIIYILMLIMSHI